MDIEKFMTLATLVKDARVQDREAFEQMEAAKAAWKKANEILTDRQKVFDEYVNSSKLEATSLNIN